MPTPQPTTHILIDLASDLVRRVEDLRRRDVVDLALYRDLSDRARRLSRLACRVDAQRRAAAGLLASGRIPRDVAATLVETSDTDDGDPGPLAA